MVISESDKVFISWQLLMCWGVISPTFPKIMDTNKLYKVHQGVTLEDAFVHEGEAIIESVKDMEEEEIKKKSKQGMFDFMKTFLITKYPNIFKEDFEGCDTIKLKNPIRIELDEEKNIQPTNITTPAEIPAHLRSATERDISRLIKAGTLAPREQPTNWSS